jgi:hypothetical protein
VDGSQVNANLAMLSRDLDKKGEAKVIPISFSDDPFKGAPRPSEILKPNPLVRSTLSTKSSPSIAPLHA